ncbi:MAG: DNA gyrase subunit A [Thermoplasmata archaeon]
MSDRASGVSYRPIEREMERSYIDYAMSVIVGRALPDVRDGLKPVQRRILYAMREMGIRANQPHRKCARVVGEVLGKFHPHGDTAVYDALVRMAQDFSLRYPLIDGQGNFGSMDGDDPAAMRYTECRLAPSAEEILQDFDKETVDFVDNFDASLKEPVVLPGKFPNLLVNGASGIAVGMSTNIPPHNLREVADAIVYLIEHEDADLEDLLEIVRGPDFPTGGVICGDEGILEAYRNGRGLLRVRGRTEVEQLPRDKKAIIITEIPYQVNKSNLVESIANLVKQKKVDGIVDLRDESDREGIRIVVELRRDVHEEIILNQLFAHTPLQVTFGVINLALVDGEPRVLSLKETLEEFIRFREDVVRRRSEFDLRKAKDRIHVVEGLLVALDNLDDVISRIRSSETVGEAQAALEKGLHLTALQAKAILDMRLHRLTALEGRSLREEREELRSRIGQLEAVLADRRRLLSIIRDETLEVREKYGDERRTEVEESAPELDMEDLIPNANTVVMISNTGYIKRQDVEDYRQQRRGGVGLVGMETKEEDYVVDLFVTKAHNYILFFTTKGRIYWLKAWRVPVGSRHARGRPIVNLLPRLEQDEAIAARVAVEDFEASKYLIFATRKGLVKKTSLAAFSRPMVRGIWAIKLREGDELVGVRPCQKGDEVILATRLGMAVRFDESDVRPTGRYTEGVKGVTLRPQDYVVSMALVRGDSTMLTVTEGGYGKCSLVSRYRKTRRGAKGVINISNIERNGAVVSVQEVHPEEELLLTTEGGMIIRFPVEDLRVIGRATMGVRIMKLKPGDRVKAVAKVAA